MNKIVIVLIFSIFAISSTLQPGFSQVQGMTDAKLENDVWHTKVGKQVQITTDVTNNQNKVQPFTYIVQIQNQKGVVLSLSWISGTLDVGQSLTPSQSWVATTPGTYTAQIFVWEDIGNPNALSPSLSMMIDAV